jgi:Family of unknown function (DUF6353)
MNLAVLSKRAGKLLADNSPLLLTAISVTGTIATAVLTGRASFKAARLLYETDLQDLPFREKVELTWQLYIPAVGTGVLTVACVIAANRIGTRRAAAMAAAYSISERAFSEYKEKVIEKFSERKEQDIRDEIAQDRVTKNPVASREVIITGMGKVLCCDTITGRYFESDMETLRKAQNDVNARIMNNMYASLHDFYVLIGLTPTPYSSEIGWNTSDLCELHYSATLAEDGRPCICVDYAPFPIRDYY